MLNNFQTMRCAMGMPGCEEQPSEALWQAPLAASAPTLPVYQDTDGGPVWDAFGAGHDDLMVYDRRGQLYAWLPSAATARMAGVQGPIAAFKPDLTTTSGYAAVRGVAILAAGGAH